WRYHVINGSPDISFKLFFGSRFGTAEVSQAKQSVLSLFKRVKNGTINIGYYRGSLPQKLSFEPSKLGNYSLKYQVVAENLGAKYDREVATIQKHGIQDLQFGQNTFSGKITTQRSGILTSSIPYSDGWTATVDGKPAKVLRTNQAFLGLRLTAGSHRIRFTYHLPGFSQGALISLIGLIWTAVAAVISIIWYHRKRA
ncbi:YfhO family protein, partial [Limosilactobacillus sp.]|uniref:YfhO family protein n=1 Tax=Limosilactobacillus sp. TaxID=2773925 RepID=UPI0035A12926